MIYTPSHLALLYLHVLFYRDILGL